MWEITTLTEFAPSGQKPDKCQFCHQVSHPCKCKVKVFLVFTHGANLRQMWHLQMVCSKFAIEVNPFFRPVYSLPLSSHAHVRDLIPGNLNSSQVHEHSCQIFSIQSRS